MADRTSGKTFFQLLNLRPKIANKKLAFFSPKRKKNKTPVTFQFQGHRRAQFDLFDRPFGVVSFETGFRSDVHVVFIFQQFFGFIRCERGFPIKQDHFDISKMFILRYKKTYNLRRRVYLLL
jgi:hypothetical protein